ncbi:hypothetical protein Tco_0135631, partial [Tanacetum coccineum]
MISVFAATVQVLHWSTKTLENVTILANIVVPVFGQLYHWLGSLCPAEGDPPRFLQLYVYDTENEVDNRMAHFGGDNSGLRRDIVEGLIELLDNHNALVQLFRTAREKLLESEVPPFK